MPQGPWIGPRLSRMEELSIRREHLGDRSKSPTVSAVILSKNGAGRLARCLESIQQSRFADEIVVCVDADTTDNTLAVAKRFTSKVHVVSTAGYIESVLEQISSLCSGDFILRVDDDESLGGNWDKASFQLLTIFNNLTHMWLPRRWIIPPGDAFIANAPWFPDIQLRLYLNDPDQVAWPAKVHERFQVAGRSIVLSDRWIDHHLLIERPRGERRRRCEEYRKLNPELDLSAVYLYEDFDYTSRPCGTSAIAAARLIQQLAAKTGLSPEDLAEKLSHVLPGIVDHLTPDGTLPKS